MYAPSSPTTGWGLGGGNDAITPPVRRITTSTAEVLGALAAAALARPSDDRAARVVREAAGDLARVIEVRAWMIESSAPDRGIASVRLTQNRRSIASHKVNMLV